MASPELQSVLAMLADGGPVRGDTIEEQRASMEAALAAIPVPDDVRLESVVVGGVPAEWTIVPASRPGRVVVYFHRGGYCLGSVRSHRLLVAGIAHAAKARVLSVDYRLAPEHPHPAAVDDAVAVYRALREQGVPASSIVFAGDSAGGGLTVAALLALRDAGDVLPAAGACLSPWFDLTLASESIRSRAALDPVCTEPMLRMMAEAYLAGCDARTPLASPLFADLKGLPPLLVQVGTAEILYDDAADTAARAGRAGVDVTFEPWEDMIHVWHAFAMLLPEGQQAIDRVGAYLAARFAKEAA
jgi:acetyl esterase/lipase